MSEYYFAAPSRPSSRVPTPAGGRRDGMWVVLTNCGLVCGHVEMEGAQAAPSYQMNLTLQAEEKS